MKLPHWRTIRDMHNAARDRRRKAIPLRPNPDYRTRRLAQFTPERQERYFENVRKAGL